MAARPPHNVGPHYQRARRRVGGVGGLGGARLQRGGRRGGGRPRRRGGRHCHHGPREGVRAGAAYQALAGGAA
eukprot:2160922-Pyramimonas_sp.AAC.1